MKNSDYIPLGSIISIAEEEYLLGQVSRDTFVLLSLKDGNRWSSPTVETMSLKNSRLCLSREAVEIMVNGKVSDGFHWKVEEK